MDGGNVKKMALVSHIVLHKYIRMPIGLKNAPAPFQKAIDVISAKALYENGLVYFDETIVFKKPPKQHFCHLREVSTLLNNAGMTTWTTKWSFISNIIDRLSHVFASSKLQVAATMKGAAKVLYNSTPISELWLFLSLSNVH